MTSTNAFAPFLTLDCSSTACGYAFWRRFAVVEFGLIKPAKGTASASARILSMTEELLTLVDELMPEYCVMEVPQGKQHSTRGRQSSLAVWGYAVGVYVGAIRTAGVEVLEVGNAWTRRKSKDDRQALAKSICTSYATRLVARPKWDKGQDVSDAIALGDWWIREVKAARMKAAKRDIKP